MWRLITRKYMIQVNAIVLITTIERVHTIHDEYVCSKKDRCADVVRRILFVLPCQKVGIIERICVNLNINLEKTLYLVIIRVCYAMQSKNNEIKNYFFIHKEPCYE